MGRRVLITGISSFLGASLARALEAEGDVDYVGGAGLDEPPVGLERTEFIKADIRSPLIHRVLTSTEVDTVVHADLTSKPMLVGGRMAQKERNVIGTMQLLGACQRVERVKKVVFRSSTAVYGAEPGDPSILREEWSDRAHVGSGYAKDVADAETFARDFGRRRPEVLLTVLRMANVVGPTAETNMTQLFSLPLVPTALGFDPRLQMLHEDDAIEVLRRAVVEDHPGVFNVAADGVIYLSQAIRLARRLPLPIIAPLGIVAGDLFRKLGLIDFPTDQIGLLVHGRVVDTTRLRTVLGFEPKYSTVEAFRDFLAARGSAPAGPRQLAEWERELYALLIRKSGERFGEPKGRPHLVGEGGGEGR